MRILLVNDDGFDEPGLMALERVLSHHDLVTVAPKHHHSGSGMSLNLYSPLSVEDHGNNRFSVDGTPVDCVKLALGELMGGNPPELVVSGINPGANVANNTWYSGTVAAATEAAFWLIPAMAVSQEYTHSPDFSLACETTLRMVDKGPCSMIEPGTLLNVNVPAVVTGGYRMTSTGTFAAEIPFRRDGSGFVFRYGPYEMQRVREGYGTDVHALLEGHISITPMSTVRHSPDGSPEISQWCSRQS